MIGVEGGIFGRLRSTADVVAELGGSAPARTGVTTWTQAFSGA